MADIRITEVKRPNGVIELRDSGNRIVGYARVDTNGIKHYYDTAMNETGKVSYDAGNGRTVYRDGKGNFAGMSYKDANGLTQYSDEHLQKSGVGYTNSDGIFTSVFSDRSSNKQENGKNEKSSQNEKKSSSGLFSDLFSSGSSSSSSGSRSSSADNASGSDGYSDPYSYPSQSSASQTRTSGRNAKTDSLPVESLIQEHMPSNFNVADGEQYAKYAAYLMLRNGRRMPGLLEEKVEKTVVSKFGPFNLLSRNGKKTVSVPKEKYYLIHHRTEEIDSYGSKLTKYENTGLTPDGRFIRYEYEVEYRKGSGTVLLDTYKRTERGYSVLPVTARNIALTDYELSHEIKDMSYDRFVTNKSAYRIEERYLDEYRETLKKEREKALEPEIEVSGKYSFWHWIAFTAIVLSLVINPGSVFGAILTLAAVLAAVYLGILTRVDDYFFSPDNMNTISFEVVMMLLTGAVIAIRYYFNRNVFDGEYENTTSLLFLGVVIAAMGVNLFEKLSFQRGLRQKKTPSEGKKLTGGISGNKSLSDKKTIGIICAVITILIGGYRLFLTLFFSRDLSKFTSLILFASGAAMIYRVEYWAPLVLSGAFFLLNLRKIIALTNLHGSYNIFFQRGPHILLCAIASAVIALIYYIANKKEE